MAVVYGMIKSNEKETFYQNIYKDFSKINEDNITSIIDCINNKVELFSKTKDSYLSDAIYIVDGIPIKTKVLIFKNENNKHDDLVDAIYTKWKKLKESMGTSVETKAFGMRVQKTSFDFEMDSSYFFRKKQGED